MAAVARRHEPRRARPSGRARLGVGPGWEAVTTRGAGRPLRQLHVHLRAAARPRRLWARRHRTLRPPTSCARVPPGPALVVHRVLPPAAVTRADGAQPSGRPALWASALHRIESAPHRRPLAGSDLRRGLRARRRALPGQRAEPPAAPRGPAHGRAGATHRSRCAIATSTPALLDGLEDWTSRTVAPTRRRGALAHPHRSRPVVARWCGSWSPPWARATRSTISAAPACALSGRATRRAA